MSAARGPRLQIKRHLLRVYRRTVMPMRHALRGGKVAAVDASDGFVATDVCGKTYNIGHRDYEPELADNFPGRIFNAALPCTNPLFLQLKKLAKGNRVSDKALDPLLKLAMDEASTVPGYDQVMERVGFIENYLAELGSRHRAHYIAGWVNLLDAHFLYWAVRHAKPRVIVQTGVSNGLSSAFMMLALAKNGPEGTLHVIDLPAVFDPADSAWTRAGEVYGVVIPEGKSSGWIVPDIYRDRFHVQVGDAKELLPKLVDRVDQDRSCSSTIPITPITT